LSRARPGYLQQLIKLIQICKSMLAEIFSEDTFTKGMVGRAVLYSGIEGVVEIPH
jgi:hypothetical protein